MNSLDRLFSPKSIAVIGASKNPVRAGHVVMNNLIKGNYDGVIMPVSLKYQSVMGVLSYRNIEVLPLIPDLAILCTNASHNIDIMTQLAAKQVKSVIILSSDGRATTPQGDFVYEHCLAIAKQHNMRILGPNSLGLLLPWKNLNASFSPVNAYQGNIAFISQSAAVCTTILDWAAEKQLGFSAFVNIGNAIDITFADLLDYFSSDPKTNAILLYVDSIKDARRFMSAARAASRNKRILVLKAGKTDAGQLAAKRHTGGNKTLDILYDSAIKRTGMLRVNNTQELFSAVETLNHTTPLRGERLAILTNGGGPAVMALDTLSNIGGKLASLDIQLYNTLDDLLPHSWSHQNPVDIVGDANEQRYAKALKAIMDSDCCDAILIMHTPSAIADSVKTAEEIIKTIQSHPRKKRFNILTNWTGGQSAKAARQRFTNAGYPTYRTPENAVTAFMHLVEYRRNQQQLMETPSSTESITAEAVIHAKNWITEKLNNNKGELLLESHHIAPLFKCFGFQTLPTYMVNEVSEAVQMAEIIGYPVAVKLCSPDIPHKSSVHGVMLNLKTANEVADATQSILDRAKMHSPHANIEGVVVQAMAKISGSEELRIKVISDPLFGPAILIGQGGSEWQLSVDAVCALPPLNTALARYNILLAIKEKKFRPQQKIDLHALSEFLVTLSQMIIQCPEIHELDIHPLLLNEDSLIILDSHITLKHYSGKIHDRLAIRPYPSELEEYTQLKDGTRALLRPILPEDEPKHAEFIKHVSKEDLYKRFFSDVGEFNHEALAKFTQIDYDREMAFVMVTLNHDTTQNEIIGVSRATISPDGNDAEFSILVRSDLKGLGLGKALLKKAIQYCLDKHVSYITGMTMPSNRGMIGLAKSFGFSVDIDFEEGVANLLLEAH
ncbi:bifunctional acetate--CoA ligase family protein/GNAT family N-acetyltransferase [Vibrio sp.]|nr:bifunctional acetate--CoA ligase family protein/GNAT family N-acetyltransferase [Vibrio sp.]